MKTLWVTADLFPQWCSDLYQNSAGSIYRHHHSQIQLQTGSCPHRRRISKYLEIHIKDMKINFECRSFFGGCQPSRGEIYQLKVYSKFLPVLIS